MVEVLIAGILLFSALAAVSRISVAALVNSAKLSERARIEAAINDNIQAMQKEDSYYTEAWIKENIGDGYFKTACDNPAKALSDHLEMAVEASDYTLVKIVNGSNTSAGAKPTDRTNGSGSKRPPVAVITRNFDSTTNPQILRITYTFQGPETDATKEIDSQSYDKENPKGEEKRMIELSPNFSAQCYST